MADRIIGTAAEDHECAINIAADCYAQTIETLNSFFCELGGVEHLPASLKISDADPDGWHGAEQAIDRAVKRGDWVEVDKLCQDYKTRVQRFIETWRERIAGKQQGEMRQLPVSRQRRKECKAAYLNYANASQARHTAGRTRNQSAG